MDRRRTLTPIAALAMALAIACQGGDQKGKDSPGASSGVGGQSFNADAFSCKKKSTKKDKKKDKKKGADLLLQADVPTWEGEIKAFIKTKCLACHGPGGTPPDLSTFEGNVDNAAMSLETMELTGAGKMPPAGGLTEDEIAAFRAWIDGGTPESVGGGGGGGDADGDADADAEADAEDDEDEEADDDEEAEDSEYDDTLCPNAARAGSDDAGASDAGGDSAAAGTGSSGSNGGVVSYSLDIAPLLSKRCVSCHDAGKQAPALNTYAAAKAAGGRIVSRTGAGTMPPGGAGIPQAERDLFAAWAAGNYLENAN